MLKRTYLHIAVLLLVPGVVFGEDNTTPEYYTDPPTQQEHIERTVEAPPTLYFFHSLSCPHCRTESAFLDHMEESYPSLSVVRHEVEDSKNHPLMIALAREHDAEQYLGLVPLTFIHGDFYAGYDSDETTGVAIEQSIRRSLGLVEGESVERAGGIAVPLLGVIYPEDYSLVGLAVTLGILDGFNVCSLGALVLIIGLSLKLQRRRAIALFGGVFILTTALVYGLLIVAWYELFEYFTRYTFLMKLSIGALSVGGGLYFLKEYLRMRKEGAVCTLQESPLVARLMERTTHVFTHKGTLLMVLGTVLLFAAVITLVEFPCSAAVPVLFAGILADAGLTTLGYMSHIGLFILFYMLDELLIFGVAVYRLKLWMMHGTFTKWAVLGEAVLLLSIGAWYLSTTLGIF